MTDVVTTDVVVADVINDVVYAANHSLSHTAITVLSWDES